MLPGMEMLACPNLAVSPQVMQHIVQVESGANPYAIGVVGGQLARQPRNMDEALATARMLESKGYNFSVGIAQVNRANLGRYGLDSYRKAFNTCDNLTAGAQILADCYGSAHGDWGKAFSCYYSGNFTTGFRDGYVQKVYASINHEAEAKQAIAALAAHADHSNPLIASTTATAHLSASKGALRPMVVYGSDSPQYRVALRSIAIDTAAAAVMPLVLSSAGQSAHGEATVPAQNMTQRWSHNTAGQAPSPSAPASAISQPTPTAGIPHSAGAGTPRLMDDGVFEPQVRGPNDPPARPAAVVQRANKPVADRADLRREQRDFSFVF